MEVRSLIPNRVEIAERDLAREKAKQEQQKNMNSFVTFMIKLANTPIMVWLLGTLIAFVCFTVCSGVKVACMILGIWMIVCMVIYHAKRNQWFTD